MGFNGFPAETKHFFARLDANNDRDWFKDHRSEYDDYVVAPALSFVETMIAPLEKIDPRIVAEPRINGSLRRIYRDTRFAKDKTPYHTHLHLIFWMGAHPLRAPGFHVVLGADHAGFGAGHWGFSGAELERYRNAVADEAGASQLLGILEDAGHNGIGVLDPPALKKTPPKYDPDCTGAMLLRHKGIVIKSSRMEREPLFQPGAVAHCEQQVQVAMPLVCWLSDTVYR